MPSLSGSKPIFDYVTLLVNSSVRGKICKILSSARVFHDIGLYLNRTISIYTLDFKSGNSINFWLSDVLLWVRV